MDQSFLKKNVCIKNYGGAVGAYDDGKITVFDLMKFISNSAKGGGAIYLRASSLVLNPNSRLEFTDNFAES